MRSEFEKLPEIENSLSDNIVFIDNKYTTHLDGFYDLVNWLNGAWYAFQEQQKKIDAVHDTKQKMIERVIELSAENEKLENRLRRLR